MTAKFYAVTPINPKVVSIGTLNFENTSQRTQLQTAQKLCKNADKNDIIKEIQHRTGWSKWRIYRERIGSS